MQLKKQGNKKSEVDWDVWGVWGGSCGWEFGQNLKKGGVGNIGVSS